MSNFKHKTTIFLPVLFVLILLTGILLGIRLAPRFSADSRIFSVKLSGYNKISDILAFIERDYVDTVNIENVKEDAIVNILQNLDPHSQYIADNKLDEVNEHLEGNFEGIGVQFRIEKDTIMIIHPISGGPSEKVGIKAGDRIVKVNGENTAGINITNKEVIRKLKGPRGTKVDVGIFRRGNPELLDFTITRDLIPTYSVDIAYMVTDSIGYIKLSKFSATTYEELVEALKTLRSKGMEKLILDLRNNAGGYLQAAIKVADEFLKEDKLIVYTEGKNRPRNYAYATNKGIFEDNELIVLIDEGSASASEILSGAIQDNDRGIIIGRRSFGKGLVQEQLNLNDGSAIRLTVARYYTPTGRSIQKPYENGLEDYFSEYYDRFINGEVFYADSIHFADSLKYTTPGGNIVYGGGGIMPDIFVPMESNENLKYYNRLINKGIIYDFAFEYCDTHRDELSRFMDWKEFDRNFRITNKTFNNLITFAEEQGIEKDQEGINEREKEIRILLKSLIGRNILDDEGFYPIYHRIDNTFQRAAEVLSGKEIEK